MIEVQNLKKSFGSTVIWKNINFTVEDGDTLAIIGRSGTGKSVLIKHLNALLSPDEGKVIIDGQNIFELEDLALRKMRHRFGFLFQGSALFDSINTFENVAFPLRHFTHKTEAEIEFLVNEALEDVKLPDAGGKNIAELSGGMQRRVALARATILRPDYLIYDEPTSGLDPQTSEEINHLINHFAEDSNITSIVVTHDMHSVLEIAHSVIFLDGGGIRWKGTINEMQESNNKELLDFITASEYKIKNNKKTEVLAA